MVISPALLQHELLQHDLPHMGADQLRVAVNQLLQNIATKDNALSQQAQELTFKQATIDKLTHENAYLKRLKFAVQSERFNAEQRSLLDETLDEDLQAVSDEIEQLTPAQPVILISNRNSINNPVPRDNIFNCCMLSLHGFQSSHQVILKQVQRVKRLVVKVLLAQLIPNVFLGI
jgi:hypothetical protein